MGICAALRMTYRLLIGDRSYSSWSLRGWLPFAVFDIPVTVEATVLYRPEFAEDMMRFASLVRTVRGGFAGADRAVERR